jgi:acetoin utilization deacetylase AcuC-like enzyme
VSDSVPIAIVPSPDHQLSGHPEGPQRFRRLPSLLESEIGGRLEPVPIEPAESADIRGVHSSRYLEHLQAATASAPALLDGGDTYVCAGSYNDALKAAGAALAISRRVLADGCALGISLARPPGHHATAERALGFCLLNNVAIAARSALAAGLDRVMIIDFDVHHGNGTQEIFESEPKVAYISLHQRGIFPGTGHLHERGTGAGEGTVMNVPLPAGTDHDGYLELFRRIVPAAIGSFRPELTLASAGYDAHWRDPLAGLQLTSATYYQIAKVLAEAAGEFGIPIVYVLEGGYDSDALFGGILATLAGSMGLRQPRDELGEPGGEGPDVSAVWHALKGHPLV